MTVEAMCERHSTIINVIAAAAVAVALEWNAYALRSGRIHWPIWCIFCNFFFHVVHFARQISSAFFGELSSVVRCRRCQMFMIYFS